MPAFHLDNREEQLIDPSDNRPQWHLGESDKELAFAEFQHALICLSEAFYRYVGKNLSIIAGEPNLTGQDCVILHTIQTMDRPKSVTELQHFTNRTDVANIQYSVRKLVRAGLVDKVPRSEGRGTTYQITPKGREIVRDFVQTRRELLSHFPDDGGRLRQRLDDARDMMVILTGLYDQASRMLTARG